MLLTDGAEPADECYCPSDDCSDSSSSGSYRRASSDNTTLIAFLVPFGIILLIVAIVLPVCIAKANANQRRMRIAAMSGAAGTTFPATRPPGYSAQPAGGFTAQPGAGGAGLPQQPPPPFGAAAEPSAPAPLPPSYGAANQPGGVFGNAAATTQPTSGDLYGQPRAAAAPGTGFSAQYSTPASYGPALTQ